MKLSAKELKALGWYKDQKKLRLQLSNPPLMYFKNATGEIVTQDITGIGLEYKAYSDEDRKERSREKRVADTRRVIKNVVR
jgi:hypothetical protein